MLQHLSQTVYGFPFKEVEEVVRTLWTEQTEELLSRYREPWSKKQDGMHEPMINAWVNWSSPVVSGLGVFPFAYPTAGASEGIREVLATQAIANRPLVVFVGEYEGYEKLAEHYGVLIHKISRETWRDTLGHWPKDATFWLSQPSSLDGNVWSDYAVFLAAISMQRPDVQVWVDLSYVGAMSTCVQRIEVDFPCVAGVVASWSKPFGVYYHRIGILWSRKEQMGLWGNRWFKNLFALKLGEVLCETFPMFHLAKVSQIQQQKTLEAIKAQIGLALVPSDVSLLATLPKNAAPEQWRKVFNRAPELDFLRVCLSPAFERQVE